MNERQKLEILRAVAAATTGESVFFYQPSQKSQAAALTELEISKCFQKIEVKGKLRKKGRKVPISQTSPQ